MEATAELAHGLNSAYMLISAFLVFFMQAGFAMLCAGSVRSKNVMNILIKNVLDACVGCMAFYFFGWGVAYGVDDDGEASSFIGAGSFFLAKNKANGGFSDWKGFIFQWAFAAAAATITSGAMAERTQFAAYLGYSFLLTAFVYPVVVHWVWDGNGWLTAWGEPNSLAVIDFAGSGVVHMTGGVAGLMGAIMVGPRTGRFGPDGKAVPMPGHNAALVVLGTFILWVGWYGFNPGSQLAIADYASAEVTARVAVITTLAAAAGGVSAMILHYALYKVWDLIAVCNGVLAGLVSITAGCPVIEPYAAVLAGAGGAVILWATGKLLLKLKIDDPLEAFAVHGACGAWAVIFVGLFATEGYVAQAYGTDELGHGQGRVRHLLRRLRQAPRQPDSRGVHDLHLGGRHHGRLLLLHEDRGSSPLLPRGGGARPRRVQARRLRVQHGEDLVVTTRIFRESQTRS